MKDIRVKQIPGFQKSAKVGKVCVEKEKHIEEGKLILTLESGKGSMDVKSETSGKVKAILVKEGDEVVLDSLLIQLEEDEKKKEMIEAEILVTQIPGFQKVSKIGKLNIVDGSEVKRGDIIFTLESGKGSMEVKSEVSGVIKEVKLKEGEQVSEGTVVALIEIEKEDESLDASYNIEKKVSKYHGEVVVIGGGPGGYVAAIRAGQSGKKTILIEKDRLGGTCLNRGCIPAKFMVQSTRVMDTIEHSDHFGIKARQEAFSMRDMVNQKKKIVDTLVSGIGNQMQKNDITVLSGEGRLGEDNTVIVETEDEKAIITYDDLILAPGSKVSYPPFEGANLEGNLTSDDLLSMEEIPESLIILGGRVIAMEFAFIYQSLGTEVTVIQRSDSIFPTMDSDVIDVLKQSAKNRGIKIYEGTSIKNIKNTLDGRKLVEFEWNGEKHFITAKELAVATGRKPALDGLNLEKAGVEISEKTRGIKVDNHMKTTADHIYAIGDATNICNLAHAASRMGIVAVENINGHNLEMKYNAVPLAIFTDPEMASVGLTEKQCKAQGIDYIVGKFPYMANGKAMVEDELEGFVKVIADKKERKIIGASIIGVEASNLISVFTNLITNEISIEQEENVIYAHPTISEIIPEAFMDLDGGSIHK